MFKKSAILMTFFVLSACASDEPKIIQAASNSPNVTLTAGMATQIEMPQEGRVQSIVVGNPDLVSAEQAGDVVNLIAKSKSGETNLIIRERDGDGDIKVFQYHLTVQSS